MSGHNHNFVQSKDINSYRTEIYTSLVASLFLHLYSQFSMVKLTNKCQAICSNPKYIRQLFWILEDEYHHHGLHKSTEQEALYIILQMFPPNFKIEFIQGYQDRKIQYNRLSITVKLNVDTKKYSKKILPFQQNTHIILSPMSIYINNIYIYIYIYIVNNIDCVIRKYSHATKAKTFLCVKYKLTSNTFDTIE